jgi:hypothetical protein
MLKKNVTFCFRSHRKGERGWKHLGEYVELREVGNSVARSALVLLSDQIKEHEMGET